MKILCPFVFYIFLIIKSTSKIVLNNVIIVDSTQTQVVLGVDRIIKVSTPTELQFPLTGSNTQLSADQSFQAIPSTILLTYGSTDASPAPSCLFTPISSSPSSCAATNGVVSGQADQYCVLTATAAADTYYDSLNYGCNINCPGILKCLAGTTINSGANLGSPKCLTLKSPPTTNGILSQDATCATTTMCTFRSNYQIYMGNKVIFGSINYQGDCVGQFVVFAQVNNNTSCLNNIFVRRCKIDYSYSNSDLGMN
jgi:hypothetical protein